MIKRLTSVSLTLLAVSGSAHALTLGQIHVQSFINEPLKAVIDVKGATAADIEALKVKLASKQAFNSAGVDWSFDLNSLQFKLVESKQGPVIEVSTQYPISEPYLSFVIDAAWQKGNLIKDYTLLLDPPVYADRIAAPVAVADLEPVVQEEPVVEEVVEQEVVQPQAVKEPDPVAKKPEKVKEQSIPVQAATSENEHGPTVAGDNLWNIAKKVRPNGTTMQQTMIAIQEANRDAFMRGNMNLLKKGQVLKIPPAEVIAAISEAAAERRVARHEKAWRAGRAIADTTKLTPDYIADTQPTAPDTPETGQAEQQSVREQDQAAPAVAVATDAQGRLVLASADDVDSEGLSGEGSATDGEAASNMQNMQGAVESAMGEAVQEAVEASELSASLKTDVESLEDQIEDAKKLLDMEDDQLSKLQQFYEELNEQENAVQMSEETDMTALDQPVDDAVNEEAEPATDGSMAEVMPADEEPAADIETESVASDLPEEVADSDSAEEMQSSEPEPAEEALAMDDASETQISDDTMPEKSQLEKTIDSMGLPPWLADKNTLMYGAGGLGAILVGLFGLIFLRRRNKSDGTADDDNILISDLQREAADKADIDLASAVAAADTTPDTAALTNPIERATTLLNYKEYERANDILDEAINEEPQNFELRAKKLEVLHASGDKQGFAEHYGVLDRANFKVLDPEKWNYIESMHKELGIDGTVDSGSTGSSSATGFLDEDSDVQEFNVSEFEEEETLDRAVEAAETLSEEAETSAKALSEAVSDETPLEEIDFSDFTLETDGEREIEAAQKPESKEIEAPDFGLADIAEDIPADKTGESAESKNDVFDLSDFDIGEDDVSLDQDASAENEIDLSDFATDEKKAALDLPEELKDELEVASIDDDKEEAFDLSDFAADSVIDDKVKELSDDDIKEIDELDLSEFSFDAFDDDKAQEESEKTAEKDSGENENVGLEDALKSFEMELDGKETTGEAVAEAKAVLEETADDLDISLDDILEEDATEKPMAEPVTNVSSTTDADEEIQAKIELAEAFAEMGDVEGAEEILNEVISEGNDEHKEQAQTVLKKYT